MEYRYHQGNLLDNIYLINNITKSDLEIDRFDNINYHQSLFDFKDKLLSIKDKHVLIVGDYDCDGICATTITKRLLEHLGINNSYYIPSRIDEGYGLSEKIVSIAHKHHYDVIITVDNGVSATSSISLANSLGIKVMIIDHHEYVDIPDCYGFIHPNLLDKDFNKLSAGALCYLLSTLFYEDDYSLVLGGLSILSDMVGVLNYNRYLLKKMMNILNTSDMYQIKLLNGASIDYDSLSFNAIPKINAVSRMGYNANILVKYFLSDKDECIKLLDSINKINDYRKNETKSECDLALSMLNRKDKLALIVSSEFKEGICGLIANRISLNYDVPCIVFSKKDGLLKGSGRSRENFNIYEYLLDTKDLFTSFGGHGQACGVCIEESKLDDLKAYIDTHKLNMLDYHKDVISVDQGDIDLDLFEKIDSLKPFGIDFKEPLIHIKDFEYKSRFLIKNKYPKFTVDNKLTAISFNECDSYRQFNDVYAYIRKDDYHQGALSLLIEELL